MMEYLDYYDELENYLGKMERSIVHKDALWHKTVHCWLYDSLGNVFFQIRKDSKTLYTTASGHVLAGETVEMGFQREIFEEIGISIESQQALFVEKNVFTMDKVKADGSVFRDRVWANIYAFLFSGTIDEFHFDLEEIDGLVFVPAREVYEIFKKGEGSVMGTKIYFDGEKNIMEEKQINFADFLVNKGETALGKYGTVLEFIINQTK